MRLAKFIAQNNICSRRKAESMILDGAVMVNGAIVKEVATFLEQGMSVKVGDQLLPQYDNAFINKRLHSTKLWKFYKPAGIVVSHKDERGRETVFDILSRLSMINSLQHVISVGRLDINSEGLLLLTNNGALSRYLEHPSNAVKRVYRCRIFGRLDNSMISEIENNIVIDGIKYKNVRITPDYNYVKNSKNSKNMWVTITLYEGKNREIRKIFAHFGIAVSRLIRISYGDFELKQLQSAELEKVDQDVVAHLMQRLS